MCDLEKFTYIHILLGNILEIFMISMRISTEININKSSDLKIPLFGYRKEL